jgi:hypothetical protein
MSERGAATPHRRERELERVLTGEGLGTLGRRAGQGKCSGRGIPHPRSPVPPNMVKCSTSPPIESGTDLAPSTQPL